MERSVKDKNVLDEFCRKFCKIVEKHCPYIVVSGFIAISSGRTRGTEDIDMIIPRISKEKFKELHKDLFKDGFFCIQSESAETIYDDYLNQNTSVRYVLKNQLLPELELKLSKDELDIYQLNTRVKLPLTGLDVWFSSINMNIAFKEELLKSEKDIEDAKHLRTVYAEMVNEDEIRNIKRMIRKLRL